MEEEVPTVGEAVSPTGLYLNSSILSVTNLGVLESEIPIDDSQAMSLFNDVFLPINPRFSSIMVVDKNGIKRWKRVDINYDNHVHTPEFPSGMPLEFYDQCFNDYLSKIAMEPLAQNQPLWEIHLFKYPTTNAAGNLIFKINHAIGDGYSLMGALLSSLQRADNPSLPLAFPSIQLHSSSSDSNSIFNKVHKMFSSMFNTTLEFSSSFMKSTLSEDDKTPIRSGVDGVEFRPITITTMTLSLDPIKQIKARLGVTVNDVITSIIFMGTRSYMQAMGPETSSAKSTALVLLNTRLFRSYKSVKEMMKPNSKSPWGNHFTFLDVSIPNLSDIESLHPLEFVKKIHQIIKKKKNSMAIHVTAWLLETLKKLRGPEIVAKYIHSTLKNTSMAIINMIGPVEQMALANHPVSGVYFMVAGGPQSLTIGMVSYMGNLRISIGAEKDFIDTNKLKFYIQNAFELMFKAAFEPSKAG